MMEVRRETVADVDAGGSDAGELEAEVDFRLGIEMPADGGLDQFAQCKARKERWMLQQMQSRRRGAERTADVDAIAALRSAAKNGRVSLADRGHGDDEL